MNRYALTFTIQHGSEPEVAEILRSYRRPRAAGAAGGPPLLRRTSVFMTGQRVVRIIDVNGDIGTVLRHLAGQPQIRAVEEALDPHLAAPRELTTAAGVRSFLHRALMMRVLHRETPPELRPGRAADQGTQRCALLYPVRAGRGAAAAEILAGGKPLAVQAGPDTSLASTTLFRRGDLLVRVFEVDGDLAGALDHVARMASRLPTIDALADVLATSHDLTTEAGFRKFLEDSRMELITDRRVGVPE